VVGHRADVTVRAAGGDDHAVGHGALVLEIDEDDVLGLLVVQASQDQLFQGFDALEAFRGFARQGFLWRAERGGAVQGWLPLRDFAISHHSKNPAAGQARF
jgi:hypothetical protein